MRAEDITIATAHIDPYLNMAINGKRKYNRETQILEPAVARPVIVDDGRLPRDDVMMTSSQADTALLTTSPALPGNNASDEWWMAYGQRIHQRFADGNPMGLRCDACTALAYFLLRTHGCSGSIAIVEQAQGNANGHWFLLIGSQENETLKFPRKFPRESFVVDLWGVGVKRQRGELNSISSVVTPASCVYSCGDNRLRIRAFTAGATTLPTMSAFKSDTFVKGWIGDSWRSSKLKALDNALNEFHENNVEASAVAAAYLAWREAKSEKYDAGPAESMRNTDGQITSLGAKFAWIGHPL